jgi:hypothetical protein
MFQKHSTSNINLRETFFMFRAFLSIITTAATIARVPSIRPAGIVIFGRGFWRCNTFSSPLFFKHLRKAKKKYKKNQKLGLRELAKVSSVQPGPA